MAKKHEEWVNATLKFLHDLRVQTYEGGWNANSIAGMNLPKGPVMDIDKRLELLLHTILAERSDTNELRTKLYKSGRNLDETNNQLTNSTKHLKTAEDLLEELWLVFEEGEDLKCGVVLAKIGTLLEKRRPEVFTKKEEENDEDTNS